MRIIAGQAHGRRLSAPRGSVTRPPTARVRESIFSRLASRLELEGTRVLDLFAGSGSLGIEALSRGAAHVTFVDSSRAAASAISRNLRALGVGSRATVMALDVRRALAKMAAKGELFDLVFIDAPYRKDWSAEILSRLGAGKLLAAKGWVVIRQSARAPELKVAGFTCVNMATLGGHRIALYRRLGAPN